MALMIYKQEAEPTVSYCAGPGPLPTPVPETSCLPLTLGSITDLLPV